MKAIVYRNYGSPDVLSCEEIARPAPGDNEVLIKVRAASVNPMDWKLMKGGPLAFRLLLSLFQPKVKRPGVDVAGQVEAVGRNITRFRPGDEVFGTCRGAFAEYACISAKASVLKSVLVAKPTGITFEQAASAPIAALTALQGLRDKGKMQPGQKVLINGAAGGVGTFAVQIAKSFGAEVTAVCSTKNLGLVRSIGADHVVDYTREDFTTGAVQYDVIFDCISNHSLPALRRILTHKGILVMVGGGDSEGLLVLLARLVKALVLSQFASQKLVTFIAKSTEEDLTILAELMAAGKVTPVIDRSYPLPEAPDAFRYAEQGHVRGKVVIRLEGTAA